MAKNFGRFKPTSARLAQYLRLHGALLPSDADSFKQGAMYEDHCVFCRSAHDHNYVFIMSSTGGNTEPVRVEGLYSCDACDNQIQAQLYTRPHQGAQDLFGEIDAFIYEGRFPALTHLHYEHLDPTVETSPPQHIRCIFCKGPTRDATDPYVDLSNTKPFYETIEVPMGCHPEGLDGGKVRVCLACVTKISNSNGFKTLDEHLDSFCTYTECARCGASYRIIHPEIDMRVAEGSVDQHMCGPCTYNHLVSSEVVTYAGLTLSDIYKGCRVFDDRSRTYWEENITIKRFSEQHCAFCKEEIIIDITILPEYIVDKFLTPGGDFICGLCGRRSVPPYLVISQGSYKIRVYIEKSDKMSLITWGPNDRLISEQLNLSSDAAAKQLLNLLPEPGLFNG